MKIQPIIPVPIMLVVLLALVFATAVIVNRNQVSTKEKIFTNIRLGIIYILVFVIGIRPMLIDDEVEFTTKNLDVLLVVDTTISMWAEDYNGKNTRMSGVMQDAEYIINELAGSNFGLITFDDESKVVCPYTQDMEYIRDLIENLYAPDSSVASGSSLSLPYKNIESLLLSTAKKENRKAIVIFFSDGEITNGSELQSYAELAPYVSSGIVVGYGTEEGGKMRDGDWGYVYDSNSHTDALSRIDEATLQQIATDLGISYVNANSGNAGIKASLEMIKESSKTIVNHEKGVELYNDTYFIFAIPLVLMLILELIYVVRKGRL